MFKGLTVPNWVLKVWTKIPQMPQNLSAQFILTSQKVLDFNKKRLHWASVVHATTHSETTNPNCHHFITSHVILFVKSNLIHKKNCEIHTSYFRIWLLEPWKLNGIGNQNQTFDLILFLVNLINQKIVFIFLEEYSYNAGWVVTIQLYCIGL